MRNQLELRDKNGLTLAMIATKTGNVAVLNVVVKEIKSLHVSGVIV